MSQNDHRDLFNESFARYQGDRTRHASFLNQEHSLVGNIEELGSDTINHFNAARSLVRISFRLHNADASGTERSMCDLARIGLLDRRDAHSDRTAAIGKADDEPAVGGALDRGRFADFDNGDAALRKPLSKAHDHDV